MTLSEQLFTALGPLFAGRLYPLLAPKDAPRPFAVITMSGTETFRTLSGPTNVRSARFDLSIYEDDNKPFAGLEALAESAQTRLEAEGAQVTDVAFGAELAIQLRVCKFSCLKLHRT